MKVLKRCGIQVYNCSMEHFYNQLYIGYLYITTGSIRLYYVEFLKVKSLQRLRTERRIRNICPLSAGVHSDSNVCVSNTSVFSSTHPCLLPLLSSQRIVSCQKVGSILRDARDRVVSLATDARSSVVACHVSHADAPFGPSSSECWAEDDSAPSGERFRPGGLQGPVRSRSAAENEKEGEENQKEGSSVSG